MKTQIIIDLDDNQRNDLKMKLDGKDSKKLLSRGEVRTMCLAMFEGMLEAELAVSKPPPSGETAEVISIYEHPWYKIAPEDEAYFEKKLKGKRADYAQAFVFGYNKVKHSRRMR